jgi:hypothetical protein
VCVGAGRARAEPRDGWPPLSACPLTCQLTPPTHSRPARRPPTPTPTRWLIAIAYWLAGGFIKSGLGNRIAYSMVAAFGKTTLGLTYSLVFGEALLSPAIPSVAARAGGIFFPLAKVRGWGGAGWRGASRGREARTQGRSHPAAAAARAPGALSAPPSTRLPALSLSRRDHPTPPPAPRQALCLACGSDPDKGTQKKMGAYVMKTCFQTTTVSSAM